MVIEAPVARVWEVLVDVESWPRWTPTMTSVRRLDDGPLRVGSSARIEQPKLRPMVWTVTELVPERSFNWVARVPGLAITGEHTITRLDDGRTRLDLAATSSGPLALPRGSGGRPAHPQLRRAGGRRDQGRGRGGHRLADPVSELASEPMTQRPREAPTERSEGVQ